VRRILVTVHATGERTGSAGSRTRQARYTKPSGIPASPAGRGRAHPSAGGSSRHPQKM
jgi:hypothetical protein